MVGPFPRSYIMLCSGDAGPRSQLHRCGTAGRFFPGGKWVGTMRNASDQLGCRFAILTTKFGLVEPDASIEPYDLHIHANRDQVRETWQRTIPQLIDSANVDIIVFHAGGCPAEYVDELRPIVRHCGVLFLRIKARFANLLKLQAGANIGAAIRSCCRH